MWNLVLVAGYSVVKRSVRGFVTIKEDQTLIAFSLIGAHMFKRALLFSYLKLLNLALSTYFGSNI